jgi:hypothetical protein
MLVKFLALWDRKLKLKAFFSWLEYMKFEEMLATIK